MSGSTNDNIIVGDEEYLLSRQKPGSSRFAVGLWDDFPTTGIGFKIQIKPRNSKPSFWNFFLLIPNEDFEIAEEMAITLCREMFFDDEIRYVEAMDDDFEEDLYLGAGVLCYRIDNIDEYEWIVSPTHMRN